MGEIFEMKCQGNFVFKTLTHRSGGTFKNADGTDVTYPSAYILKVDENLENGEINEHKFKIAENNTMLLNVLKGFKPYEQLVLQFEVTLYTNRIGFEVVNVIED